MEKKVEELIRNYKEPFYGTIKENKLDENNENNSIGIEDFIQPGLYKASKAIREITSENEELYQKIVSDRNIINEMKKKLRNNK